MAWQTLGEVVESGVYPLCNGGDQGWTGLGWRPMMKLCVVQIEGDKETVMAEYDGAQAWSEAETVRNAMQADVRARLTKLRFAVRWRTPAARWVAA
jgi:hypothetical protein